MDHPLRSRRLSVTLTGSFIEHFSDLEDPRTQNHNFRHQLSDIFIIAILGTLCGADGWVEIERFGQAKQAWLSTFLSLPHGIPSHDTFGRVFSKLDPTLFEQCFSRWIASLAIDLKKEIIALDGKTLRGSSNKRRGEPALHIVSAWATKNRLLLAQMKTADKSNEITAIPKLLDLIDIKQSVITIDAMGCQKKIARHIYEKQADYVLALKDNHRLLHRSVKALFHAAEENKQKQYKNILHRRRVEKISGHGRREIRKYTLVSARDPSFLGIDWPGIQGIGKVEVRRFVGKEEFKSTRYFLTSLDYEQIGTFMEAVRKHWQIEIDLHWSLDVSFREDHSQVREVNAAQNLALLRRIALNLLKQEKSIKNGITVKRKTAGWDHAYLLKVLGVNHENFLQE